MTEIGDQAVIAAQSGISKNVPAKEMWLGSPAGPIRAQKEITAYINRLPKLAERVKQLEKRLDEAEE